MQKSDYWKGLVMIMNKNCNIVRDLIPLYSDNTASDESRKFIEEHCRTCDECNRILSLSKTEIDKTAHLDDEINSVWKSIEKQNKKKRIIKSCNCGYFGCCSYPLNYYRGKLYVRC